MKDNRDFLKEIEMLEKSFSIPLKVKETEEEDTKSKKFDSSRKLKGFFDIKGRIQRTRVKYSPSRTYLINMELRNGSHTTFVVYCQKDYFVYKKGTYIIDDDMKYYNIEAEMYCLDYHQDLAIPIRRKIPLNDLRKILTSSGFIEVETAINPSSLKQFQESSIIQQVLKGQELDTAIKQLRLITIIGALSSVALLVFIVFKSGVIQGVL